MLSGSPQPERAAELLVRQLRGEGTADQLTRLGITQPAISALSPLLPLPEDDVELAVTLGLAWLRGRASVPIGNESWAPVFSGVTLEARRYPRLTGETLIGLVGRARTEIDIATAYVDAGGVSILLPSLEAAVRRGVHLRFVAVRELERGHALDDLRAALDEIERGGAVQIVPLERGFGFPHLKVITVDDRYGYIGSANFTRGGLTTNYELGALVEGEGVPALKGFVDNLVAGTFESAPDDPADGTRP